VPVTEFVKQVLAVREMVL